MKKVFAAKAGPDLNDPARRAAVEQSVAGLNTIPQVVGVGDPYTTKSISRDGRIALATAQFSVKAADVRRPRSTP